MIEKRPTPKPEVGKTKLTFMYNLIILRIHRKPSDFLFPNRLPLSYYDLTKFSNAMCCAYMIFF